MIAMTDKLPISPLRCDLSGEKASPMLEGDFALIVHQGAGDAVCATAAIRDLHAAYPGRFRVWWQGTYRDLSLHNPNFEQGPAPVGIPAVYLSVTTDEYRDDDPHFCTLWTDRLAKAIGIPIPSVRIGGDVRLSEIERTCRPMVEGRYWLMFAGGKEDMTVKWWPSESYQAVVDLLRDKIQFVQVGHDADHHPPLRGVIDMIGRTGTRDMVRLVYHADGGVGPISFGMHLAAAVEAPHGKPKRRAYVVIAGGREPANFVHYPGHRFLSTIGTMPCCSRTACWKYKTKSDYEGSPDTCLSPRLLSRVPFAECMLKIKPETVAQAILDYYEPKLIGSN